MRQGFLNIIILVVIAVVAAGTGGYFFIFKDITLFEKGALQNNAEKIDSRQRDEAPKNLTEDIKNKKPESVVQNKEIKPVQSEKIQLSQEKNPQNIHPIQVNAPQNNEHGVTPANFMPQDKVSVPSASRDVIWLSENFGWKPSGTPLPCPEPFAIQTPVDMKLVTAALWPGQARGGYKGHGGFRFGNSSADDIIVRAPIGGHLVQASQYLESGDKQYLLFFSVPCGFFYRFDHARVLSPKLVEAVKNLPPAVEGDSRTSFITPPVWVDQGEVVSMSVGVLPSNIFIDLGLYDVRKPNGITPNPQWADLYYEDKEFGQHGVCFFDYLPSADGALMRSLPTGKEGKVSDYCK